MTPETLRQFVAEKAAESRRLASVRTGMAEGLLSGSDADWREGAALARRMDPHFRGKGLTRAERERDAATNERIAAKYTAEAEQFEAVLALLDAQPSDAGEREAFDAGYDSALNGKTPYPSHEEGRALAYAAWKASQQPPERCPHCSFQPTNMNDFCDKHRPAQREQENKA